MQPQREAPLPAATAGETSAGREAPPSDTAAGVKPLWAALLSCRTHFTGAVLFSAFINLLHLAPALYMLQVYNRVLPSKSLATLLLLSALLAAALFTLAMLDWLRARLLTKIGIQLSNRLSARIVQSDLGQRFSPSRKAEVIREFDTLRLSIGGPAAVALMDLPWTPIYLAVMFLLHPVLGGLVLVGGGTLFALAWLNERAVRVPSRIASEASAQSYRWMSEGSAAGASGRLFGFTRAAEGRHLLERDRALQFQDMATQRTARYAAAIKFLRSVLQSAVIAAAAILAMNHSLTMGAIVAASIISARAFAPVEQLMGAWRQVVQGRAALGSLNDLLSAAELQGTRQALPKPAGSVEVRDLWAAVAPTNRALLAEITFRARPGDLVVINGKMGAGKTTLMQTMAGIVPISRGAVLIDGADIRQWDAEALSDHLGYFSQSAFLISGTVAENISRSASSRLQGGQPPGAVVEAALAAGVHEEILRFPNGYDTMLGPDGAGLSTGEALLVALARTVYGKPSVVFLDDPAAVLGPALPELVPRLLRILKQARITVVMTSRGPVPPGADLLLFMDAGKLVEPAPRRRPETPKVEAFGAPNLNLSAAGGV